MPRGSDLVFVGDVHLDRDDPDLPPFVAMLRSVAVTAGRIVLMGDLFNLWIGSPELEQAHHRAVVEALRDIRKGGTEVHYLEGNRDYRIRGVHRGPTFDEVDDVGIEERWAGRKIWAAHGDLINVRDLQYRTWRRLSRSALVWGAFSAIPARRRFRLAESMERSMRGTNLSMKRAFPEALVRAYAAPRLSGGCDAVVLGHFHSEHELPAGTDGAKKIFVLPEWKGTRRHLRVSGDGAMRFESA